MWQLDWGIFTTSANFSGSERLELRHLHGDFHKWGYPKPKWMVYFMENPMKMDDLEVLLFQETTIYIYIDPICSSEAVLLP